MSEIKVGDVVMLKSGGPTMTVKEVTERGLLCEWFAGDKLERAVFNPETLDIYEP